RNRIAFSLSGSMPWSKPTRRASRRGPGTACPPTPRTARSSAFPERAEVQDQVRHLRFQRHRAHRRWHHVADRLCGDRTDRCRRGEARRTREEGGQLTPHTRKLTPHQEAVAATFT